MKRYMLNMLFVLLLCLCGCTEEETNQQMMHPSVDVTATRFYDLSELRMFFVPHHMDSAVHAGELEGVSREEFMEKLLTYHEVNQQFPVELLKTASPQCKYIIYPVYQGGLYYVFLSYFKPKELGEQTPETTDYMYVRFTAYLGDADSTTEYSPVDYYKIKPGTTTMSDVMKLDPNTEPVFLSGGTYTCSLLDNSSVLQIRYRYKQDSDNLDSFSFDSLVAMEVAIKRIEDSVSILAEIS